jgi:tetratricopeptide (TPR) repeat protein
MNIVQTVKKTQQIQLGLLILVVGVSLMPGSTLSCAVTSISWNLGMIDWTRAVRANNDPLQLERTAWWWEQTSAACPQQSTRWLYLGSAYERMGNDPQALTTWAEVEQVFDRLIEQGQTWLDLQAPQLALPWFQATTVVEPTVSDSWYYTAQAFMQLGNAAEALSALEQALQAPKRVKVTPGQIRYAIGYTHQYVAQPPRIEDAVNAYRAALIAEQQYPDNQLAADIYFRLCDASWSRGEDPDRYIAECRQALARNPNHLLAHFVLGIAYFNKYHDIDMAVREFESAHAIEPSPWGFVMLGYYVYEAAGQQDKAREAYLYAIENWPDFEVAYRHLEQLETGTQ